MLIPAYSTEVENLYYRLISQSHCCLAICSPTENSGVSTIASALCQRLLLAGKSALMVELNQRHPSLSRIMDINPTEKDDNSPFAAPSLMSPEGEQLIITAVAPSTHKEHRVRLKQPNVLREQLQQWQNTFDYIIVDAGALQNSDESCISCSQIVESCGLFVLTIVACETTEMDVENALTKIDRTRAELMGCLINDVRNPSLKSELIRELNRLPRWLSRPKATLINAVKQSRFLSLEC